MRKLINYDGQSSGVVLRLGEKINSHKWKSPWVILNEGELSWYTIDRVYWKSSINKAFLVVDDDKENWMPELDDFWMKYDLYNFKIEDKRILQSTDGWLNDRIMDAAQKLICKTLGIENTYQSVLNCKMRDNVPYQPVSDDHIQILHDGDNHWLLSFCSNRRVQICDSLRTTLSRVSQKCVRALYKKCVDRRGRVVISFLPVQKQPDGYNCGVFSIAFAAEILDGASPIDAKFDVQTNASTFDVLFRKHETHSVSQNS